MSKSKPEHVWHIADTHQDNIGKALCGVEVGGVRFVDDPEVGGRKYKELVPWAGTFVDLDHWFNAVRNGNRMLACRECARQVNRALSCGTEGSKTYWADKEKAG